MSRRVGKSPAENVRLCDSPVRNSGSCDDLVHVRRNDRPAPEVLGAQGAPVKGDAIGRTVIPTLNQILHGDSAVHVEPKAMSVLLHLAARRGEVARREELIQEIWHTTFVTDDVLKRCISDLRKALGDDRKEPRFIETIPKVGYRLIAPVEPVEPQEEAERDSPATTSAALVAGGRRRMWATLAAAGVVVLGAAAATMLWAVRRPDAPAAPRVVQLSSERRAVGPAFSPDGKQIAFASPGDAGDNWDIWLRIVGEAESLRLTTSEAPDLWPAWAPDGKLIAFERFDAGVGTIYVVSPIAGAERRPLDFPVGAIAVVVAGWTVAGCRKAAGPPASFGTGIYLIPFAGGEPRQVTFPSASAFDTTPAISPDGSALAYLSCEGADPGFSCDVWVPRSTSRAGRMKSLAPDAAGGSSPRAWRGRATAAPSSTAPRRRASPDSGGSARTPARLRSPWNWLVWVPSIPPPSAAATGWPTWMQRYGHLPLRTGCGRESPHCVGSLRLQSSILTRWPADRLWVLSSG